MITANSNLAADANTGQKWVSKLREWRIDAQSTCDQWPVMSDAAKDEARVRWCDAWTSPGAAWPTCSLCSAKAVRDESHASVKQSEATVAKSAIVELLEFRLFGNRFQETMARHHRAPQFFFEFFSSVASDSAPVAGSVFILVESSGIPLLGDLGCGLLTEHREDQFCPSHVVSQARALW